MPVMDGLEASQKLFELKNTTPIIALTASLMTQEMEEYSEYGMSDYLGKPFQAKDLWACLLKYLKPVKMIPVENGVKHSQAGNAADEVINRVQGLIMMSGDEKMYKKILGEFYTVHKKSFNIIVDAVQNGNIADAHREVHTLKSIAGQIGASALQKKARIIELALAHGAVEYTESQLQEFKTEFDRVMAEIMPQETKKEFVGV
jgi:CheY-like chemotaxis protein